MTFEHALADLGGVPANRLTDTQALTGLLLAAANAAGLNPAAGEIAVTQYRSIPGGVAISGRYTFTAQRTDLYDDDLGQLTIHGSFVAPLVTYSTSCEQ